MINITKYHPFRYRIIKIRRRTIPEVNRYMVQARFLFFFWTSVSPMFNTKEEAKQFYLLNFKDDAKG